MAEQEFAPGLPDPRRFGHVASLPIDRPLRYVIQRHLAARAGPHFDIRIGPDHGHKPTMLSWAARRLPEEPGQKTLNFMQPLHTGAYSDFEGEIVSGYGKGVVKTHDKGAVLVTKVTPDKINFVVIHKKHPETFTMIRKSGPPVEPGMSERTKKTQGGTWLLINTTPTEVIPHKKVHYTKVPAEKVHKLFDPEYLMQEKLDGAACLFKLFSDRIEAVSYRPTTTSRPIIHTYRIGGMTNVDIPKHLVGSVLRGELYGVRTPTGEAIPAQELGGILNASTLKALEKQREQKVKLKSAIFNVLRYGNAPVSIDTPLAQRMQQLKEIMEYLPKDKFHLPRSAETVEEQKKLWDEIRSGKYPLTHEGVVAWPRKGGKPTKVKLYDEHDVYVKEIFPGKGRLAETGAGGFRYALAPEGPIVGEVGTGFSEDVRRQMWEEPEEFIGRIAKIKAQEQFPSGAYRAPAFLALHEDYPAVQPIQKAARAVSLRELQERLGATDVPIVLGRRPLYIPPLQTRFIPELAHVPKGRGVVVLPLRATPAEAAHELAHATGLGRSGTYTSLAALPLAHAGSRPIPHAPVPLIAGALAGLAKGPKAGGLVGGLTFAPVFVEEMRANLRAGRKLREAGLLSGSAFRQLLRGQLSYVLPAALAVGGGLLSGKIGTAVKSVGKGYAVAKKIASRPVLVPLIKQATGGRCSTLADFVKLAAQPALSPELAREIGIKPKINIGDRIRALVMGVKPEDVQTLQWGFSHGADMLRKLKELVSFPRALESER